MANHQNGLGHQCGSAGPHSHSYLPCVVNRPQSPAAAILMPHFNTGGLECLLSSCETGQISLPLHCLTAVCLISTLMVYNTDCPHVHRTKGIGCTSCLHCLPPKWT
eukprot:1161811-Pelagomonas_calceolata.AAC.5